jgi:hypothetical protein
MRSCANTCMSNREASSAKPPPRSARSNSSSSVCSSIRRARLFKSRIGELLSLGQKRAALIVDDADGVAHVLETAMLVCQLRLQLLDATT